MGTIHERVSAADAHLHAAPPSVTQANGPECPSHLWLLGNLMVLKAMG